ncbi:MAG: ATP-binding protein, partial [Planctomycetota bacterium]|nr:ATP-binding protein [Planctomycetota bacterium]
MSIFPFVSIVGQYAMRAALCLVAVDPEIGGILLFGRRGTSKSTAVRGLADLLPTLEVPEGCPIQCTPNETAGLCRVCENGNQPERAETPTPLITLPLGAAEEAVTGSLDLGRALTEGVRRFEAGCLGRAHRGILYVDEANLLEDHLVDLLLDSAASGINVVEREGISVRHPAHFLLIGSGNPEEGELRPQFLDRFGLLVQVESLSREEDRVEVARRRIHFDRDPKQFVEKVDAETDRLRHAIADARKRVQSIELTETDLLLITRAAARLDLEGHRGEIAWARAARALAALLGESQVSPAALRATAPLATLHRMHRDP